MVGAHHSMTRQAEAQFMPMESWWLACDKIHQFLSKDFWKWLNTDIIFAPTWSNIKSTMIFQDFPLALFVLSFFRKHVIGTSQVSGIRQNMKKHGSLTCQIDMVSLWVTPATSVMWNSARWMTGSWSTWHSLPIDLLRVLRERGHHRGAVL